MDEQERSALMGEIYLKLDLLGHDVPLDEYPREIAEEAYEEWKTMQRRQWEMLHRMSAAAMRTFEAYVDRHLAHSKSVADETAKEVEDFLSL